MKWMENDLFTNGEKFSILGLELFYPKEKVIGILRFSFYIPLGGVLLSTTFPLRRKKLEKPFKTHFFI
jgi:hypothetical protein